MYIKPETFTISFGRDEKADLVIEILEDFLRRQDFTDMEYSDMTLVRRISEVFFELKNNLCAGEATCRVNLYIMEKLSEIILNYRNKGYNKSSKIKGSWSMCGSLWIWLKSTVDKYSK